jgi:hypothetical protein
MWSRVQIAALTALLATSYLPDRIEAKPGPSIFGRVLEFQSISQASESLLTFSPQPRRPSCMHLMWTLG